MYCNINYTHSRGHPIGYQGFLGSEVFHRRHEAEKFHRRRQDPDEDQDDAEQVRAVEAEKGKGGEEEEPGRYKGAECDQDDAGQAQVREDEGGHDEGGGGEVRKCVLEARRGQL